ncbi:hypothetical protein F4777DRAFT_597012 [Nemania sp. FL0916]|nr:hypothetical protein F4777DRAFT_597012 [Nemania sp. FL0916]
MDTRFTNSNICPLDSEVKRGGWWYGHLPCVCHSNRGCCQHNPAALPIYHNHHLPSNARSAHYYTRLLSWIWHSFQTFLQPEKTFHVASKPLLIDDESAKEAEPLPPFCSELPFDSQSVDTLAPSHPSMPYHLAIYHLDCVRRQLQPEVEVAFIPELSCSGTSCFYPNGPSYTWSSEIYFQTGTFLQKQELHYIVHKSFSCRTLTFSLCPHVPLKITGPWFTEDNGFLTARALLRYPRKRFEEDYNFKLWTSKMGRFARMSMCNTCHADGETTLELVGQQLHIRYTCYRDLGSATDRSTPQWRSLLTGQGVINRHMSFALCKRVWQTAQQLGRPNLHLVPHVWSQGVVYLNEP